jgi:NAD(P)-dependent dehydrogenase (short-subunit alcohol dehydrogenase family)
VSSEVAVVVGASGALGSAITTRLAGAGLPVVAVAPKAPADGPDVTGCAADIGTD